jgi:hypothetical protein
MALIDDPRAYILRLFEMEETEGRGHHCQRFPGGATPLGVPLVDGERVYGIYRDKYIFTPMSLMIQRSGGVDRVAWNSIRGCSTRHGDGKKVSTLVLVDGTALDVRVGDMAVGWSGRISQLFHKMIERYGSRAFVGSRLYSIEEFFAIATDDCCLFPNIEPRLSLDALREALLSLRNRSEVTDVLLVTEIEDDGPVCNGLIVRSSAPKSEFSRFAESLGADGVMRASANELRQVNDLRAGEEVWHIVWD